MKSRFYCTNLKQINSRGLLNLIWKHVFHKNGPNIAITIPIFFLWIQILIRSHNPPQNTNACLQVIHGFHSSFKDTMDHPTWTWSLGPSGAGPSDLGPGRCCLAHARHRGSNPGHMGASQGNSLGIDQDEHTENWSKMNFVWSLGRTGTPQRSINQALTANNNDQRKN